MASRRRYSAPRIRRNSSRRAALREFVLKMATPMSPSRGMKPRAAATALLTRSRRRSQGGILFYFTRKIISCGGCGVEYKVKVSLGFLRFTDDEDVVERSVCDHACAWDETDDEGPSKTETA